MDGEAFGRVIILLFYLLFTIEFCFCFKAGIHQNQVLETGLFSIVFSVDNRTSPSISVFHKDDSTRIIWETHPSFAFLSTAIGKEKIKGENNANFRVREKILSYCDQIQISGIDMSNESVVVGGYITGDGECVDGGIGFLMKFTSVNRNRLQVSVSLVTSQKPDKQEESYNRIILSYSSPSDEKIFGFGQQYSFFNMKGHSVEILSREQGIGRGLQPLTFILNGFEDGTGGDPFTTYTTIPHYITTKNTSLFLESSEYAIFDMKSHLETVTIEVFSSSMIFDILNGHSPLELIEEYTLFSGRMNRLPEWINSGAVVALSGGTSSVMETVEKMIAQNISISALWLQDWVGTRNQTIFGHVQERLWWNWELDETLYTNWTQFLSTLSSRYNIRVMTYINPFLTDVSKKPYYKRNYFLEANELGYLVCNSSGQPYTIESGPGFVAGQIDLTNPNARTWYKSIIKNNMLQYGISGWMADYGEYLPFDANLFSGEKASILHNQYPQMWAALCREAIEEYSREYCTLQAKECNEALQNEIVFFSRSGWMQSPAKSTLFWLGDQLVSWDSYDGIKTAVIGMLSSGISGFSLSHSDIGGYTTINVNPVKYVRSKELLLRWIEMAAFTTTMRTHLGSIPFVNYQVYSDEETMQHFSLFSRIFHLFSEYRAYYMDEASTKGYPIVRHLYLHYPNDLAVLNITYEQFLFGEKIMIAPVLDFGKSELNVYFPVGEWIDFWTGIIYGSPEHSVYEKINTPIGRPGVFCSKSSFSLCSQSKLLGL